MQASLRNCSYIKLPYEIPGIKYRGCSYACCFAYCIHVKPKCKKCCKVLTWIYPTLALRTNINKDAFFWPMNVNKKEAGSDVTTNQRVREVQVADSQPTTALGWQWRHNQSASEGSAGSDVTTKQRVREPYPRCTIASIWVRFSGILQFSKCTR